MEQNDSLTACRPDGEKFESEITQAAQADLRFNLRTMFAAFVVGIGLMGLKFLGYWITGSAAILSDALESIINVVASGFGLGSIVLSAKPADESPP